MKHECNWYCRDNTHATLSWATPGYKYERFIQTIDQEFYHDTFGIELIEMLPALEGPSRFDYSDEVRSKWILHDGKIPKFLSIADQLYTEPALLIFRVINQEKWNQVNRAT